MMSQLTSRDLTNQEPAIHELNEAVDAVIGGESSLVGGAGHAQSGPLVNKRREMNDLYSVVQVLARDQAHMLRDRYRQVCLSVYHIVVYACYLSHWYSIARDRL